MRKVAFAAIGQRDVGVGVRRFGLARQRRLQQFHGLLGVGAIVGGE